MAKRRELSMRTIRELLRIALSNERISARNIGRSLRVSHPTVQKYVQAVREAGLDWEKIQAALKSDVGGSSAIAMPEEYRELVRHYFEEISKSGTR